MAQRVHEVAKEMGKSAAAVVAAMKKIGINKKALSTLTDAEVEMVRSLEIEEVEVGATASVKRSATKKEKSVKKVAAKKEKSAKKAVVEKEVPAKKVAAMKEVPAEKGLVPKNSVTTRPSLRKSTNLRIRLLRRGKL